MANHMKGEVSFTVDGISYTVVLTMGAQIEAEEALSTPTRDVYWDEIIQKVNAGSAKHTRVLVWALFRKHHPDLTIQQVGQLIDKVGGLEAFAAQAMAVRAGAEPDPEDTKVLGKAKNRPQRAQGARGTGENSTSPPAPSA